MLSMYRPSVCCAYVCCQFAMRACDVYIPSVYVCLSAFLTWLAVCSSSVFGCLPSALCSPRDSVLCAIHPWVLCVLAVVLCVVCVRPSVCYM